MGTRASFFIGDPRDLEKRKWLGCIAWDGYIGETTEPLQAVKTEEDFHNAVNEIEKNCDHFTNPKDSGFPFPWANDLFLTDYIYAFFDGQVMVASFHRGFAPISECAGDFDFNTLADLPSDCPAPAAYDKENGKDSIMILCAK